MQQATNQPLTARGTFCSLGPRQCPLNDHEGGRRILTAVSMTQISVVLAVGALLLSGCATARYQLEARLAGTSTDWRPSGTPASEEVCMRTAARLMGTPFYRDGKPYTILARCVKEEN